MPHLKQTQLIAFVGAGVFINNGFAVLHSARNEFAVGIVSIVPCKCGAEKTGGVAVNAAVDTAVVGADVNALAASAAIALIFIGRHIHGAAADIFNAGAGDAGGMFNAVLREIGGFAAGLNAKSAVCGGFAHKFCKLGDLAVGQRSYIGTFDFGIEIHKAYHNRVGVGGELAAKTGKLLAVIFDGDVVVDDDGIVSPDHTAASQTLRKLNKGILYLLFGAKIGFKVFAVGRNSELEIIFISQRVQLVKMRQHICGILCPKDDAVHRVRREGDTVKL